MAMMIRNAVVPFAAMLASRAAGALGPIETNSTRLVAALNRKKPGINETTAEKATAAKGRCSDRRRVLPRRYSNWGAARSESGTMIRKSWRRALVEMCSNYPESHDHDACR
jgi:hypothetical protein